MHKNVVRLTHRIRNGEVVLWAGAGFNSVADLPTSTSLIKAIKSRCDVTEIAELDQCGDSLSRVAEAFVKTRSGSRQDLVLLLQKLLDPPTANLELHDLVRAMIQLHDIVTTNYDRLFERSFGTNLTSVSEDTDLPLIRLRTRRLFKIHGDLARPETMIITESDYSRARTRNKTIWRAISSMLAQRSALFIGYRLGDPDVRRMFEDLSRNLKPMGPEHFLVVPEVSSSDEQWLRQHSICIIDSKGEDLLREVGREVTKHLLEDYLEGTHDLRDAVSFFYSKGVIVGAETDPSGTRLTKLEPVEGQDLSLVLNLSPQAGFRLQSYLEDVSQDVLVLPAEGISSAEIVLECGSVEIPQMFRKGVTFKRKPVKVMKGLLRCDDACVAVAVVAKVFTGPHTRLSFEHSAFVMDSIHEPSRPRWRCVFRHTPSIQGMLDGMRIISAFLDGKLVRFSSPDSETPYEFPPLALLTLESRPLAERVNNTMRFCEGLLRVERHFDVRLKCPRAVARGDAVALAQALKAIEPRSLPAAVLSVTLLAESIRDLDLVFARGGVVRIVSGTPELVTLLGRQIRLGYLIYEIPDPIVENESEARAALSRGEPGITLTVRSASDGMTIRYSQNRSN